MEQQGSHRIKATQQEVWGALHDPATLQACLAGCEDMQQIKDGEYHATVAAKVGPVRARFQATVHTLDEIPFDSYTLQVEVKGGVAGFGKGTATITLTQLDDATQLDYVVKGAVGGRMAQIGSRLVVSASRKMADDFFAKFANLW